MTYNDGNLILFGGSKGTEVLSQLWTFNLADRVWTRVEEDPASKSPARCASMCLSMNSDRGRNVFIVLFGITTVTLEDGDRPFSGGWMNGALTGTLAEDIWMFDFATKMWSEVKSVGNVPEARFGAAYTSLSDRKFVLNGGYSAKHAYLGDTFAGVLLDNMTLAWQEIATSYVAPTAGHTALFPDILKSLEPRSTALLYFYGGLQSDQAHAVATVQSLEIGCDVGQYSADFTRTTCQLCPRGKYSALPGQSQCRSCPGQSYT